MSRPATYVLQARPRAAGPLAAVAALLLAACNGGGGGGAGAPAPIDAAGGAVPALFEDPAGALPGAAVGETPDASIGAPGQTADCSDGLPCRWTDADGAFAVTLTRADNTGRDGRLQVHLRVETIHDSELAVTLARTAVDVTGTRSAVVSAALDGGVGSTSVPAGARLPGTVDFDAPLPGGSVPEWGLVMSDNGTVRAAAFANVPLGPKRGDVIDCANRLPCTWTSEDGLASVDLVGAGGFASERRLHVNLRLSSSAALTLVAGPETSASAPGGAVYLARSHAADGRGGQPGDTIAVAAGVPVDARIDFLRAPGTPATLATLTLDLYRDAPVPRWRPAFANVPAVAP